MIESVTVETSEAPASVLYLEIAKRYVGELALIVALASIAALAVIR